MCERNKREMMYTINKEDNKEVNKRSQTIFVFIVIIDYWSAVSFIFSLSLLDMFSPESQESVFADIIR